MKRLETGRGKINVNIRQINVMLALNFQKDDEVIFFRRPRTVVYSSVISIML